MKTAANFAFANRAVLTDRLFKGLRAELGERVELSTLYDVSHNIAKIEDHVIHGKTAPVLFTAKVQQERLVVNNQNLFTKFSDRSTCHRTWRYGQRLLDYGGSTFGSKPSLW